MLSSGTRTSSQTSTPQAHRPREPKTRIGVCRRATWKLVDDPMSSRAARAVAILIMALIGLSVITFCLETLPDFRGKGGSVWNTIEAVCIGVFTLEFLTRLFTTPSYCTFIKSVLNIVDFVAIVPFYVELIVAEEGGSGSSAVFRVIRLVRVFRVFKISRYLSWVKIFASAMLQSAQPLGMLVFIMMIGTVVFSSAIYYAERGEWHEDQRAYIRSGEAGPSPFQSIPASFWWCIITMTTVGYGDDVPITLAGKLIAAFTSLCGILVLAIPITVISTNFNAEYLKVMKKRARVRARMLMLKSHFQKSRTGLEAIQEELSDIVKRNTEELREEVDNIIGSARQELTEELNQLLRLTYSKRRQLLFTQTAHGQAPLRRQRTGVAPVDLYRERAHSSLRNSSFRRRSQNNPSRGRNSASSVWSEAKPGAPPPFDTKQYTPGRSQASFDETVVPLGTDNEEITHHAWNDSMVGGGIEVEDVGSAETTPRRGKSRANTAKVTPSAIASHQ